MNVLRCSMALAALLILSGSGIAGMPSVLPEDLPTILRLNEEPHQRLQVISFFLLAICLTAAAVMALWNVLARDFPRLPRLNFPKALSLVVLCGLLFVVVLTMISGARELMTPGAWKKSGITYTVDNGTPASESAAPDGEPEAN
jgi:drug/metabolite transporter (DMT)-like permease